MNRMNRPRPWLRGRAWLSLLALLLILGAWPPSARASGAPSALPGDGLATLLLVSAGVVAIVWLARGRSRAPDLQWPDHHEPPPPPARKPPPRESASEPEPAQPEPQDDARELDWELHQGPAEPAPDDLEAPDVGPPPPLPTGAAPRADDGDEVSGSSRRPPDARGDPRQLAWSLRPSRRGLMAVLSGAF